MCPKRLYNKIELFLNADFTVETYEIDLFILKKRVCVRLSGRVRYAYVKELN